MPEVQGARRVHDEAALSDRVAPEPDVGAARAWRIGSTTSNALLDRLVPASGPKRRTSRTKPTKNAPRAAPRRR
jgi:hypothetical protein